MITYGGRVLNTYKNKSNDSHSIETPNPLIKGGSPLQPNVTQSTPVQQNLTQSSPVQPNLNQEIEIGEKQYKGGDNSIDSEEFKEAFKEFSKESPELVYGAIRNAAVNGTFLGQLFGPTLAAILGWILYIMTSSWTILMYIIAILFVLIVCAVILMGLTMTHAAIDGILIPLKAVYNIKILGGRLFGFLGGPVSSLQRTKDGIAKTVPELFWNLFMNMLK